MGKLKLLSKHKIANIPDHIIEEMEMFSRKLGDATVDIIDNASPNIALSGMGWVYAAMLKRIVSNNPEELRKAVKFSCEMLIGNMEILIEKDKDKQK